MLAKLLAPNLLADIHEGPLPHDKGHRVHGYGSCRLKALFTANTHVYTNLNHSQIPLQIHSTGPLYIKMHHTLIRVLQKAIPVEPMRIQSKSTGDYI